MSWDLVMNLHEASKISNRKSSSSYKHKKNKTNAPMTAEQRFSKNLGRYDREDLIAPGTGLSSKEKKLQKKAMKACK